MENKPASLLVVLLIKALNGISPNCWYGRQVASNSYKRARYSALFAFRARRIIMQLNTKQITMH